MFSQELIHRLGHFKGFFHALVGKLPKDIQGGTKEVDALVEAKLKNRGQAQTLEYEMAFPSLVEMRGNVFEYEDWGRGRLEKELSQTYKALDKFKVPQKYR
jgi:hypothetical protein